MRSRDLRYERTPKIDEAIGQMNFLEKLRSELADEETTLAKRIQYVIREQERVSALMVTLEKDLEGYIGNK